MSCYGFIHGWWTTSKYLQNGTIFVFKLLLGGGEFSWCYICQYVKERKLIDC